MNDKDNQTDFDKNDQSNAPIDTSIDVSHLYQPNKASFEDAIPSKRNLSTLAKHFFWIYIAIFGVSIVVLIMLIILTKGALFVLSMWLLVFALFIVPYMAYRLCLDKFPENDSSQSLRREFIAVAIAFAIIIPLAFSFLIFALCTGGFYL